MIKNSRKKIKEGIVARLSFLWLALSIFFSSYFPTISRYSVNTLFNREKRGYFIFLFTDFGLRDRNRPVPEVFSETCNEDLGWIRGFGIILLLCYVLHIVCKEFSLFYATKARQSFRKIINERYEIEEDTEWTKSFSDRVVNDFASFFSHFCELFIEILAVNIINRRREIKKPVIVKTFKVFCYLMIITCGLLVAKNAVARKERIKKGTELSLVANGVQQQLFSPELGNMITAFYFVFYPSDQELIDVVLLGFNIMSISNKLRRFISVIPQTFSTYKMGAETKDKHTVKLLHVD